MSGKNSVPEGIAIDLLFAAQPFTGLEHHALHVLRGLHQVGASVDVLVPSDVVPEIQDAVNGHRVVPFPRVPRGLRLGREQWSFPWRFGTYPRAAASPLRARRRPRAQAPPPSADSAR